MSYAERYVGFYLSFLVPTIAFCLTLPILYFCRNHYKHVKPEGSVLGPALKLVVLGSKGRIHANPLATYRHFTDGTFWENVKPSRFAPGARPKWMQFDDQWVSEVARGFAACKVFLFFPLYCKLISNSFVILVLIIFKGLPTTKSTTT
jgi:POT family proton-dependent oligopeptide transporter